MKKSLLLISLFSILIVLCNGCNKKTDDNVTNKTDKVNYPQIYLNTLEKDMQDIINNNKILEETRDLRISYETSTLKEIITNEKTMNNFLYIGFISYLTDHNESTMINNDSKKEYLGKSDKKVTDYTVFKIFINGFNDNEINNINNISAIVFELSNKEYLMCQFVRTNNSTIEYDSKKYMQYDVLYAYSIYKDYEDFVLSIQSTKYKIDEFKEISPSEFNEIMNENKNFINNYIDYKSNYYYPSLLVDIKTENNENKTQGNDSDCYPSKPRYLCYEDGRCRCVSSEVYQCHKYNICSKD